MSLLHEVSGLDGCRRFLYAHPPFAKADKIILVSLWHQSLLGLRGILTIIIVTLRHRQNSNGTDSTVARLSLGMK